MSGAQGLKTIKEITENRSRIMSIEQLVTACGQIATALSRMTPYTEHGGAMKLHATSLHKAIVKASDLSNSLEMTDRFTLLEMALTTHGKALGDEYRRINGGEA